MPVHPLEANKNIHWPQPSGSELLISLMIMRWMSLILESYFLSCSKMPLVFSATSSFNSWKIVSSCSSSFEEKAVMMYLTLSMSLNASCRMNQLSTTNRRCSLYFYCSMFSLPTAKVLPMMAMSIFSKWIIMMKQAAQKTRLSRISIRPSPRVKLAWSVWPTIMLPM